MKAFAARLALILIAVASAANTAGAAGSVIHWRVENPFRLFTDPADTEVHRATYRSLGPEERASPVLAAEHALQRRHDDGWAATMYKKTCWNAQTNTYSCDAYADYMNPTSHVIVATMAGVEDAASFKCKWSSAPKGGDKARGVVLEQGCDEPATFEVPYPEGATLKVEIGGVEVASTDAKVRDLLVVAAGDSFGSGEGNPDIAVRFSRDRTSDYGKSLLSSDLAGFPARVGDWKSIGDKKFISENARWSDQACHRSLYSYQLRAALELAVEDPHRAVTFVGLACSGAEVTFGLFLRYKGNEWVPNPPVLSQISGIAEAQCGRRKTEALDLPEAYHINGLIPELKGGLVLRKCAQENARKIDLVVLSVGGNDIGFSRLVANAVLSNESTLRQLGGWFGEVHGQSEADQALLRLDAKYKSLNRALHSLLYVPWDESDRILLVSYPGMALAGDGSETCKDGHAGMEVVADFQLSEQKLREGAWIADKLHHVMRDSADKNGWTFVETHRRAFIDRGICSGRAEDGANIHDDLRLPRKVDGVWKPYNPADYQAYASRQRWFRTPNDGFMTGNFHVEASLLQKVLKFSTLPSFQLLLASTYSGAFHPTAEGHAAIADAVVDKARAVLAKYGEAPDPEDAIADVPIAAPVDEPGIAIPEVKLDAPPVKPAEAAKIEPPAAAHPAEAVKAEPPPATSPLPADEPLEATGPPVIVVPESASETPVETAPPETAPSDERSVRKPFAPPSGMAASPGADSPATP